MPAAGQRLAWLCVLVVQQGETRCEQPLQPVVFERSWPAVLNVDTVCQGSFVLSVVCVVVLGFGCASVTCSVEGSEEGPCFCNGGCCAAGLCLACGTAAAGPARLLETGLQHATKLHIHAATSFVSKHDVSARILCVSVTTSCYYSFHTTSSMQQCCCWPCPATAMQACPPTNPRLTATLCVSAV
jgi:hypothetical protein